MRRAPFNDGWIVGSKTNSFAELIAGSGSEPEPVTLPHDAMIGAERSPSGHGATAYFPSGTWEYRKSFEVSPDDAGSAIFLEFDGVYRDGRVRVNDALVAHRPGGYSDFIVQIDHLLRFGETNEVKVEARAHDDSRWYSGAGIYRNVWLLQGGRVHLVAGRAAGGHARDRRRRGRGGGQRGGAEPVDHRVGRGAPPGGARLGRHVRRRGRGAGDDGTGGRPHGPAAALCPAAAPLGPGRSVPVHLPGDPHGRRADRGRGVDDLRHPGPFRRPGAGSAHQRGDRPSSWCLCAPRQRPPRGGHHRPRRGTPGRAPQGGWVQRHQERPQPPEQAHARRL